MYLPGMVLLLGSFWGSHLPGQGARVERWRLDTEVLARAPSRQVSVELHTRRTGQADLGRSRSRSSPGSLLSERCSAWWVRSPRQVGHIRRFSRRLTGSHRGLKTESISRRTDNDHGADEVEQRH